MKKIFAIFVAMLFLGCTKSPQIDPNARYITISSSLKSDISLGDLRYESKSVGLMRVQYTLINSSANSAGIVYRVQWFDNAGFEIKGLTSKWRAADIGPKQSIVLSSIAPSQKASSFHIYVDKAILYKKDQILN